MKKYTEIENSYREKYIHRFLQYHPEVEDELFVIQEKIDGSNFQIKYFLNDKNEIEYKLYSRNQRTNEDFQGAREAIEKAIKDFNPLAEVYFEPIRDSRNSIPLVEFFLRPIRNSEIANTKEYSFSIFGEVFGQGIQNRIFYGPKKYFKVFDIVASSEYMPQNVVEAHLKNLGLIDYLVPKIDVVKGLQNALDYPIEFDSKLTDLVNNQCEGIVIKPYGKVYVDGNGSPFYLKKKNAKFSEGKEKKPKEPEKEEVVYLQEAIKDFINDNRLQSCFSKEGEINYPEEIGKYIKLIMEDVRKDFLKDYQEELEKLDKKDQKKVFGICGREISKLLTKYL